MVRRIHKVETAVEPRFQNLRDLVPLHATEVKRLQQLGRSPSIVGLLDERLERADGRLVLFSSDATNLVPGDTNGWRDGLGRSR